jgi:hypothetical protein
MESLYDEAECSRGNCRILLHFASQLAKKAPEYSEALSVENIGFVNKGFEALDCALT